MKGKSIRIKVQSSFAVGLTKEFRNKFSGERDINMDIAVGTTIDDLLRQISSIGPADEWDDMMLTVFVNGEARGYDYILSNGDVVDLHIPTGGG